MVYIVVSALLCRCSCTANYFNLYTVCCVYLCVYAVKQNTSWLYFNKEVMMSVDELK